MTWIEERLTAYDHVCRVYDAYLERLGLFCKKGCDTCCTVNVTVTSLEAFRMAEYLQGQERTDLIAAVRSAVNGKRFHPGLTLNAIADICNQGKEPPEEVMDPSWGQCPLLKDQICSIYEVRPFSCRCMVSTSDCRNEGYARTDEFTVTVNNVMMQYIEHIDQTGFTGNMLDMILYMEEQNIRNTYSAGEQLPPPARGVANKPVSVLLASPRDRQHLSPILQRLNKQER
ncbi:MAG: YkgJ family cysteine cluster protein [Thermodesulfobacteriota bacterium]|nr:YkgJ family cysteine cluster protein [Thermodesulfobacteriota bacterium]